MSLRLSEILEHDAPHLGVTSRKHLGAFYDALVDALRQGQLTPEGGALPTTLNTLLALLPGEQPPLRWDKEIRTGRSRTTPTTPPSSTTGVHSSKHHPRKAGKSGLSPLPYTRRSRSSRS